MKMNPVNLHKALKNGMFLVCCMIFLFIPLNIHALTTFILTAQFPELGLMETAIADTFFPSVAWQEKTPADAGMDAAKLDEFHTMLGAASYGAVVKDGDMGSSTTTAQILSNYTTVSIQGEQFYINGRPTYEGRTWNGNIIEGLLFNARLVQGIFDDLNPETRGLWKYPDTGEWDPDRNTTEFVSAMPEWRRYGMLAFTLNIQGGNPIGYGQNRDWLNPGYLPDGSLRADCMARLENILNKADEIGMVVILGLFYFGQDQHLADEAAVKNAVMNVIHWLLDRGYRNVLIEVNNECNGGDYDHAILNADRVHELIELVSSIEKNGFRFPVGTSYTGTAIPANNVVRVSDFILIHGNGAEDPAQITEMVRLTRNLAEYRPMPILFNEDDHYDFDNPINNLVAAIQSYSSWGFFDYRRSGESFQNGFQSIPVDWSIDSNRKIAFFEKVSDITGDDTPWPVRSSGMPTGTLPSNTVSTTLSLATDKEATCKYATTRGTAYGAMANQFITTGSTAHATTVSGLHNGQTYNYYVRCQDQAGNANTNDYLITFRIALADTVFPGATWQEKTPADAGMDAAKLDEFRNKLGLASYGVVVKDGYLVYQWGNQTQHDEWASATKPLFGTLIGFAIQEGRITSPDVLIMDYGWPLIQKDQTMTFHHLANMLSGYSLPEVPGESWAYNDYGIQLLSKTLYEKLYGISASSVSAVTAHVTDPSRLGTLQFQDGSLFLSKKGGTRIYMTPRDFARLGWFWVNKGNWNGVQLLPQDYFHGIMRPQVPADLSTTEGGITNDYLGIGTYGGTNNQSAENYKGHYGFGWTFNLDLEGVTKLWPDVPGDAFHAYGHSGVHTMVMIPSLGIVAAWNDGNVISGDLVINDVFATLADSVLSSTPTASFSYTPANPAAESAVQFTDESLSASGITAWSWDFGDGATSTDQHPSHIYASAGSYSVLLLVSEADGDASTTSQDVVVAPPNQPPVADAGFDQAANEGVSVSFDGSGSTDPNGTIVSYTWSFGDGGAGSEATTNHTYADNGIYTVTLTVTDNNGATDTDTLVMAVNNVAPTAVSGGPYNGVVNQAVSFTGSVTDPGTLDTHTYSWDFGDGTPLANGQTVAHAYATVGTFLVTLTATDDDGAVGTTTTTATIVDKIEVFFDSFETAPGDNWNGLWTEDSQDDWYISLQRAVSGTLSAEVDGSANNARLTSRAINLHGQTSATITFLWFIERSLDSGEYLSFEVSTNGGSTWTELARLRGNVDQENVWHARTFQLTGINNLRLRFKGKMSSSDEDANVDDVRVIAY
jgi:PKD repeat protein